MTESIATEITQAPGDAIAEFQNTEMGLDRAQAIAV